jgi:MFS family permease
MKRDTGVLLLLGLAHSLNHSLFLVLPPLLADISRDLGASFQEIGMVATVAFFLYGLGALLGGPLSDRIGHVKVASISLGLSGASTLLFLLPSSLAVFSAGLWIISGWASFYHPTANTLIAKLYPGNKARSMGIHGASGSVGQMLRLGVPLEARLRLLRCNLNSHKPHDAMDSLSPSISSLRENSARPDPQGPGPLDPHLL